ncbi:MULTISPECIES: DUF6113 family protein [unclassified Streptomyces]|uniref:DUF6113 family protein n=1 Tax=unclassified Streptomyces TaxID=2593676 RepID=UPI0006B02115|nr:DUF6113 family protein [Streptomyces sp. WM6378]KOU35845.1 membrane protein [Streptomyces sp. WM6378]
MDDTRTGGGAARIALYLLLVVLGALVGVAGALVQTAWFPGGLALSLAGAVGLFYSGTQLMGGRGGVGAPAAGWLVAVILLTASRPEGDFVFGAGAGSYVFLLGGMVAAVICATIGGFAQPGGQAARLGE